MGHQTTEPGEVMDPEQSIEDLHRMLIETTQMRSERGLRETQDEMLDALSDAHRLAYSGTTKKG